MLYFQIAEETCKRQSTFTYIVLTDPSALHLKADRNCFLRLILSSLNQRWDTSLTGLWITRNRLALHTPPLQHFFKWNILGKQKNIINTFYNKYTQINKKYIIHTTEALCITFLILVPLCVPGRNHYLEFGVYYSQAGFFTFIYVHIHKQQVALFAIFKF